MLVIGAFVLQNQPQEVVETPEEQGENVENASEQVDIANRQAYRNEEYGFEVKVPEEWSIEKEGESSMFTIKRDPIDSNNKLYFTVSIERSNKDPQFWFADNVEDPKNKYNDSYKVIEENKKMGNNSFYYLKKVSDKLEYWYVDNAYVVSSGEQIFFIQFREKSGPENWQYDYSSYLHIFETFVRSLNFI